MKHHRLFSFILMAAMALSGLAGATAFPAVAASQSFDITTLAGKVASVNSTQGLFIHLSAFIEQEAQVEGSNPSPGAPISPSFVLSSPLDGTSVLPDDVTVNQDTAGAPQNETAIAVDPNNPNRVVAAANDYVTRTWDCDINGTPCSALGDGYSGTYFSNNGGQTWCCNNSGPSDLGTLIPGVNRLAGGMYDAGGDPALAFDSQGNVYYAGLGFNRTSPPNTVAVNKGTFDSSGALTWGPPTFINPTTAPAILNDKEWIAADSNPDSPYADRVYVTWTRFIFNSKNGHYSQSPIAIAYSRDHGKAFSGPQLISGDVLYSQGSRPVVGPDGTVYVFFEGSTRLAQLNSIYMVKSTNGGKSWSKPVEVAPAVDILPPVNTNFRVNSYPAVGVDPSTGDLYAAWSTEVMNDASDGTADAGCAYFYHSTSTVYANCHAAAVYSTSTNGGATWSTPAFIFSGLNASRQTADGYSGTPLSAPSPTPYVDTFWPGIAISPSGVVYMSAYAADYVSPWQTCATPEVGAAGRISCLALDGYIHNARLDYYVRNLALSTEQMVSTHPINTRNGFGGGFIGDYTDLAVGSNNVYHAFWTDTNNKQYVEWWYGYQFVPSAYINQQDVVTYSGTILPPP